MGQLPEDPACCVAVLWHLSLFMEGVTTVSELQDIARTLYLAVEDLREVAKECTLSRLNADLVAK